MKLIIEDDEGRRTVIPLFRDRLTIGRAPDNTVRLGEKNVSRKHGRLVREDGRIFIEDVGSFTGILVNGEQEHGALNRTQDEADAEARYRELESALAGRDAARARELFEQLGRTRTYWGAQAAQKADQLRALQATNPRDRR